MAVNVTWAAGLAGDSVFRDRALVAALLEAITVLREDPATPGHTFRKGYAQSLLRGPEQYQATITWVLAAAFADNATYVGQPQDQIPDEVLYGVLGQMWDALSMP